VTNKPSAVPSPADGVIHQESDNCRSWDGGHLVHFTQGMRANGAHRGTRSFVPCTVTDATDDGWFTLVIAGTGRTVRYWHHNPLRAQTLVGQTYVEVSETWSLIHQRAWWGSSAYVSITSNPLRCSTEREDDDGTLLFRASPWRVTRPAPTDEPTQAEEES
jgi:hypothetical protein